MRSLIAVAITFAVFCTTLFAQLDNFSALLSVVPDSAGMVLCVNNYKDLRKNEFRRAIIDPVIFGKPASFSDDTRQIGKLSAKVDALEEAAGFRFVGENLDPLIGDEAVLAFYGVGDVEFVYATLLPSRLAGTALESQRRWYEEHQRGNVKYWTAQKERQGAWGAFFIDGRMLVISNSERQFQRALSLAVRENDKSIAADDETMRSIEYCGFKPKGVQAAVVLNTAILTDDKYYNRYYQGVPPSRQNYSRVSFGFSFDGKIATIKRASIPNEGIELQYNDVIPSFADLCPERTIAFYEFLPKNCAELLHRIPLVEYLIADTAEKLPFVRAACVWTPELETNRVIGIAPIVVLSSKSDINDWLKEHLKNVETAASKNNIEGYEVKWQKKQDGITTLSDPMGIELGFAYAIRNGLLILSPQSEVISDFSRSTKIEKLFEKSGLARNGISCCAIVSGMLGYYTELHIRMLKKWDLLESYSAKRFTDEFALPIAEKVMQNVRDIASVESNINGEYLLTTTVVRLK